MFTVDVQTRCCLLHFPMPFQTNCSPLRITQEKHGFQLDSMWHCECITCGTVINTPSFKEEFSVLCNEPIASCTSVMLLLHFCQPSSDGNAVVSSPAHFWPPFWNGPKGGLVTLVNFLGPGSRFQLEFVLANQITEQPIGCITKTASGEEDVISVPVPRLNDEGC